MSNPVAGGAVVLDFGRGTIDTIHVIVDPAKVGLLSAQLSPAGDGS